MHNAWGDKFIETFKRWDMGWMVGGSSSGGGWEFFSSPRPERLWGPPSLLSNGYQALFHLG